MAVRRRRRCDDCDKRFTTYENFTQQLPALVKADGRRENFNREKIIKGLTKACQKRPVSRDQIHALIDGLERHLAELSLKEIRSDLIGNYVMEELYKLDPVSYVRFASFYWTFNDVQDFVSNLEKSPLQPLINNESLNSKGSQLEI
jgi:transcriptional repressor NrdR